MRKIKVLGIFMLYLLLNSCSKKESAFIAPQPPQGPTKPAWVPGQPLINGVYKLFNPNTQCIQVNNLSNGGLVEQNTYIANTNQQWEITNLTGGYYKIINRASGKAMEVPGGSTAQNVQLQQSTYTGTNRQQWKIEHVASGKYKITNRGSGLAVTLDQNSTAQFAKITQTTYVANNAHQWSPTFTQLPKINISGKQFIRQDGQVFKVWGFNYDYMFTQQRTHQLIDDKWQNQSNMDSIKQDFQQMKALGSNVVRLHLQFNKFMTNATTPNAAALDRLKKIVGFATDNNQYLILTGLCSYRESDDPAWYKGTSVTTAQRWAAQTVFWQAVAGAVANNPTIFAYDLMNEPTGPPWSAVTSWVHPAPAGYPFTYTQYLSRDHTQVMDYVNITNNWINQISAAIRAVDNTTPITVGFIPAANYVQFRNNSYINYMSIHVYPETGNPDAANTIAAYDSQNTKPLLVEEVYTAFSITPNDLQTFMQNNDSKVNGWVSFFWGDDQAWLAQYPNDWPAAIQIQWLNKFQAMSPNYVLNP
ncbi:hypothetical protein DJ568_09290 [Mucilaginibacter hurinus]|uniref:Ricin B lectin domain-containing protein n=1 Tax=Mucilaginibacter hurinus TaxID=2201324 RepID=A0A367GPF8_9SPHI|nr:RICIN domain-containing protein [Mucilaginibacter hurinus]RCH55364.1 hypothetical protein DJ568_09290 [Mucilaginibacter hurinus]